MAKEVLEWVFNWCKIDPKSFDSIGDLLSFAADWGRCPKKKRIFLAIVYGFVWSMWKTRNDCNFNRKKATVAGITDNICTLVFDWVKHRGSFANCNWAHWICFPFIIL